MDIRRLKISESQICIWQPTDAHSVTPECLLTCRVCMASGRVAVPRSTSLMSCLLSGRVSGWGVTIPRSCCTASARSSNCDRVTTSILPLERESTTVHRLSSILILLYWKAIIILCLRTDKLSKVFLCPLRQPYLHPVEITSRLTSTGHGFSLN